MKKILWLCSVLVLLTGSVLYAQEKNPSLPKGRTVAPVLAPNPKKTTERKDESCGSATHPFVVTIWPTVSPFGWQDIIKPSIGDPIYEPYGLFYHLIKTVAEHNNKAVAFHPTPTVQDAEAAVIEQQADIILGYYYDNNPYAKFQPIYPAVMQNPIVIVTLTGNMPQERALENLANKKGAMRTDENLYAVIKPMLPEHMKIKQLPSAEAAFKQLLSKKIDFIITSLYTAEAELRRFKLKDVVEISEPIKYPTIFFAVSKTNRCKREIQDFYKKHIVPITSDYETMGEMLREQLNSWQDRFLYNPPLLPDTEELPTTEEDAPDNTEARPKN